MSDPETTSQMLTYLESKMTHEELRAEMHKRRLDQENNIIKPSAQIIYELYQERIHDAT